MLGSSAKASSSSEDFVKETVSSRDIVIFSKSYCAYCARVKSLFEETKKPFAVIDLDEREDGEDIQNALAKLVGRWTVPQVFIKGEHIGGCDDTVGAYRSGKLKKLLAEID
ncbi:glutaredoxin-C8-like [Asparagus officinalis]|uniref:glutaredoxin-C8-like n=1 Tax=Asparagus officinalis TaxID=4686 RepID=UPI00098E2631|nr:glutaredoxin-C8-like [Asparagus officinalis]